MLQRVQLLLDQKTKQELDQIAAFSGQSVSSVVRDMLSKQLAHEKTKKKKLTGVEFLRFLADNAVKGPGDCEYDKYAYDY